MQKELKQEKQEKENKIFIVVYLGMKGSRGIRLEESREEGKEPQRERPKELIYNVFMSLRA